jgi:hypothetical protein
MKILSDRCTMCGSPIYFDDEVNRNILTCNCLETLPSCCSDGGCEGMCFCDPDDKEEE